jgi:cell division protein FtsI/penicillin-binding protein 2
LPDNCTARTATLATPMKLGTRRVPRWPVPLVLAAMLPAGLTACGDSPPDPTPAAQRLAAGIASGDLAKVRFANVTRATARQQLATAIEGMRGLRPTVRVRDLHHGDGNDRIVTLAISWDLDRTDKDWTYRTKAALNLDGEVWKVRWASRLLHPDLTRARRLVLRLDTPPRADIRGAGGAVLVTDRPVRRIGIDRTKVDAAGAAASASSLARVVDVDAEAFAGRVAAAGPKAFVEAITLRERDARPLLGDIAAIDGAVALTSKTPLAPTRDFARPILGTVGEATAEIVEKSNGRVRAGDVVGLTGLQQRYDDRLRGVPATTVEMNPVAAPGDAVTGSGSAGDEDSNAPVVLFRTEAVPGTPLETTLDETYQRRAETLLADVGPASALVAIQPSTGNVLAAASGPGGKGLSTATVGRYAPGSTFKVVTSLALLRAGLSPATAVRCTPTMVVDGKRFKNYDDYPAGALGRIPLRSAVANSCNTAFIDRRDDVSQADLSKAAESLGLGVDHDVGLPAFFGSVPTEAGGTEHAASMIGQGKVLSSPLAMAVVAASVARGATVVPHLLAEQAPQQNHGTLTQAEARALRGLMRGVVTEGSGRFLRGLPGPPIGAKTGTAEYGSGTPLRTHGWMIAIRGDLAVAVFVEDAVSGSRTAGPLLERFLRSARS